MKAQVLNAIKQPLNMEHHDDLSPENSEVVIEIVAAALNRRDYWITQGMYPGIRTPVTLGSDGAGRVVSCGSDVSDLAAGDEVIINPGWAWGDNPMVQDEAFRILGMPDNGTFATQLVAPREQVYPKPPHLNWHEASALPLAGVTAYRAVITQGKLSRGERCLVTGIGGGVATFAVQFAAALGAEVAVTSSSDEKIANAERFGATAGFNYTQDGWTQQARERFGEFDLIVDGAGGAGYNQLVDLAAFGGRIVNYGATAGPPAKFDLFKLFWKQLKLTGSTMGSPQDFQSMLDFVNEHQIRPVVDGAYPLEGVNEALDRMKNSKQLGKIILEVSSIG